MDEVLFVDAFQSLEDLDHDPESLLNGESLAGEPGLVGEQVALVAVVQDNEDEVRCVQGCFLPHDILVVELLHDFDFLLDVFLQKRLFFDLCLRDDLDSEELVLRFWVDKSLLLRESSTYPKAPLPMERTT